MSNIHNETYREMLAEILRTTTQEQQEGKLKHSIWYLKKRIQETI